MDINFVGQNFSPKGICIIGNFEGQNLQGKALDIDKMTNGALIHAMQNRNFKGQKGESIRVTASAENPVNEYIIVGMGQEKDLTILALEEFGAKICDLLERGKDQEACLSIPPLSVEGISEEEAVARIAFGFLLKTWKFEKYKTQKKDEDKVLLQTLGLMTGQGEQAARLFSSLREVAQGIFLTRHVVSEPPNVIYPETLASTAKELEAVGVTVEILNEADMKKLGMNALLGVGQGSVRESRMVLLSWNGGSQDQAPLAIVGKGVTFDTGGISLKPADNMDDMKYDMAGSGVVLGLMRALAGRRAKVNVIGVMGLVENMPSGSAQRPGDIVTTLSGQTIEVLNTDAEGRLVLSDALWYAQNRFRPQAMVDLATLTGAIIVALGHEHAGLFSNNDALAGQLVEAGRHTGEKLWRLPLEKAYDKDIDSDVADVKNIGSGRGAGSITAAQFPQRFVNDVPWAHLDIAGTAWDKKGRPLSVKGATAFGVRLLNQWIQANYE